MSPVLVVTLIWAGILILTAPLWVALCKAAHRGDEQLEDAEAREGANVIQFPPRLRMVEPAPVDVPVDAGWEWPKPPPDAA